MTQSKILSKEEVEIDEERARPIPGFPGYFVSDQGGVFSSLRAGKFRYKRLIQSPKNGYLRVSMRSKKKTVPRFVHRLVLEAFVGPCPKGSETRHLDGMRTHNWLSNLVWGTRAENEADKVAHGTVLTGERGYQTRLTEIDVQDIRRYLAFTKLSKAEIARRYGVGWSTIDCIARGRSWKWLR